MKKQTFPKEFSMGQIDSQLFLLEVSKKAKEAAFKWGCNKQTIDDFIKEITDNAKNIEG